VVASPNTHQRSHRVIALDPANFTSLARTPWAGTALAASIKSAFATSPLQKIGESWEISCDPEAPSRLADDPSLTLHELIQADPVSYLSGSLVAAGRTSCDILVKLLNADSPLSLQIHPSDDHPALKQNECGKPESWFVLQAAPGAGLYLGFRDPMPLPDLQKRLESGTFQSELLQFVPVTTGDYFEIEPHVPHAVGPGVILLEPQRIIAGKSGKTWRLWDWNRRYNKSGALDEHNGTPRELHISQSMSLLHPENQSGAAYADSLRRKAHTVTPLPGVLAHIFPANRWYQVITLNLRAWSKIRLKPDAGYACATILSGHGQAQNTMQSPSPLMAGQSYFFPAASLPVEIASREDALFMSLVIPAGMGVTNHGGQIFE
jgi:mannose-6-phosphate isomerase